MAVFRAEENQAIPAPKGQVKSGLNSQAKIPTFSSFHAARSRARPSDTLSVAYMGGIGLDCRLFDAFAGKVFSNILNTKEMRKWTN